MRDTIDWHYVYLELGLNMDIYEKIQNEFMDVEIFESECKQDDS